MIQTIMQDLVFARGDDWPEIPFQVILDAPVWNSLAPYSIGDTVSYLGVVYTCTVANTNKFPLTNPANWSVGGVPVNIAGWGLEFMLSASQSFEPPLFPALTLGSGLALVDATVGTFNATVLEAQSNFCVVPNFNLPAAHNFQVHRADPPNRRLIGFGTIPVRS